VEVEPLPQQAQEKIEEAKTADLVIGIVAELDREALVVLRDGLRTLSGSPRVAIMVDDRTLHPDSASPEAFEKSGGPFLVPWPKLTPDTPGTPMASVANAYQSVFAACEQFGAQACGVIASKLETASPDWIRQLVGPLLEDGVDLVAPRYARHKFEGLLNSSIIAPLTENESTIRWDPIWGFRGASSRRWPPQTEIPGVG
jgi:hypothetical protein